MKVGCEGPDGLLRIHDERETCEVCAPPPAADAVSEAMVETALDACAREGDEPWRQLPEEVVAMLKADMRRAIDAALAARDAK